MRQTYLDTLPDVLTGRFYGHRMDDSSRHLVTESEHPVSIQYSFYGELSELKVNIQ
jgi:hypothetical protein